MNPDPFTLRQLIWMAEGRQRDEWDRLSYWIAAYCNTQRDPQKHKAFQPRDFNPYLSAERERERAIEEANEIDRIKAITYRPAAAPNGVNTHGKVS